MQKCTSKVTSLPVANLLVTCRWPVSLVSGLSVEGSYSSQLPRTLFASISPIAYQSFCTHGSFVPRRFVPRLRHFVPTFDQFVPNPLVDLYPTNYETKWLNNHDIVSLADLSEYICLLSQSTYMTKRTYSTQ